MLFFGSLMDGPGVCPGVQKRLKLCLIDIKRIFFQSLYFFLRLFDIKDVLSNISIKCNMIDTIVDYWQNLFSVSPFCYSVSNVIDLSIITNIGIANNKYFCFVILYLLYAYILSLKILLLKTII